MGLGPGSCLFLIWFEAAMSGMWGGSAQSEMLKLPVSAIVIKSVCLSPSQAVRRPRSRTPSSLPGWPTPSPRPAPRAVWVAAAVTRRSRASTTRRRAGSGGAARRTSTTAWASPRCSWTHGKLSRTPGRSWIYITMKWDARYVCISLFDFYLSTSKSHHNHPLISYIY